MKATCEVVVERELLLMALGVDTAIQLLLGPDDVEIGAGEFGITVVTASVDCELEAGGNWDHLVLASRGMIEMFLEKSSRPTVKLLFVGNQLFVDRQPVPVQDLGPDGPLRMRRERSGIGQPYQQSLYLPDPPGGKLRPRRAQATLRGLPLFGG